MKILLAVDGSECSDGAVKSVVQRPWPPGSEIKIISAVEPVYFPTTDTWVLPENYYLEIELAAQEHAQAAIKSAVERFEAAKTTDLTIITEVKDGLARDVILEEAEKWEADLIVLGSHGYSGLKKFLLGSVSHAVAAHAHCSVELVRQRPETRSA
jgi:nucleotide-binding universal stress UspA family protein